MKHAIVIGLVVAVSTAAGAQTREEGRPQGQQAPQTQKGGAAEQAPAQQGGKQERAPTAQRAGEPAQGAAKPETPKEPRAANTQAQGTPAREGKSDDKKPAAAPAKEGQAATGTPATPSSGEREKQTKESPASNQQGGADKRGNADANRAGTDTRRQDAGKSTGREGGEKRVTIQIAPEQRTRVREVFVQDSAIRRYRRSDLTFSIGVGSRIPETIVYYDPPPRLIEINEDFRRYKVIIVDENTLLVVDPDTREIIEVIDI